ncbi:hypothetical protein G6O67_002663 [Ophiocordyceps sinensis]|uniref:Uncharacterized protein n=1 Tax=Ophiocordyceps sinensis TaxID=72228 RepID=A0A8H4V7G8_9HYPO|nr:hypothetical protein G6O67_002663 [Ophiocordyceps sinensis]
MARGQPKKVYKRNSPGGTGHDAIGLRHGQVACERVQQTPSPPSAVVSHARTAAVDFAQELAASEPSSTPESVLGARSSFRVIASLKKKMRDYRLKLMTAS